MAFEVACLLTELGEQVDLLAVIDAGPGCRDRKPQPGDRWKRLSRIVANLPSWARDELSQFSARSLAERLARKLRRLYRYVSHGRAIELDDVFRVDHLATQNRELMDVIFAGVRDYMPRTFPGKVTLFRAKTQPLLKGSSHDLGWSRFVDVLEVHEFSGNHESILHPPQVSQMAQQLGELLDDLIPLPHDKPELARNCGDSEDPI